MVRVTLARYWRGNPPALCDKCNNSITNEFVDGATTTGEWANMCPQCYPVHGKGTGLGVGQRYKKLSDGRWLRIEG